MIWIKQYFPTLRKLWSVYEENSKSISNNTWKSYNSERLYIRLSAQYIHLRANNYNLCSNYFYSSLRVKVPMYPWLLNVYV